MLNNQSLELPTITEYIAGQRVAIPVALKRDNSIRVIHTSEDPVCAGARVKQSVEITTHALSRVHFNTNVSDFAVAREFYGSLGFATVSGFPDTNTQAMARAIGIETPTSYDGSSGDHAGGYLLHGELVGPGGFAGGVIDLIEFTIPKNNEPPYPQLNHLGMARAVMHTGNLAATWEDMRSAGVEFLSAPVTREDGSGFVIFRDPDGTSYELRQSAPQSTADAGPAASGITRLGAVNINVSDLERSSAWYQLLGFEPGESQRHHLAADEAQALGFKAATQNATTVTHAIDRSTLELVRWLDPFDATPPYPLPVNHLGIHRMAFSTSDIEADVATLKEQGVKLVSPITPCCSGDDSWGAIIAFEDPDGTIVELVEQPLMTPLITLSTRLARWTGASR